MKEQIEAYVNGLFADAALTMRNAELRQEILQHTFDRYDDLLASGMSEQEAYAQAVAGIGDISELLEHVQNPASAARDFPAAPAAQKASANAAQQPTPREKKRRRLPIWARIVIGLAIIVLVLNFAGNSSIFQDYRYDNASQYQVLQRSGFGSTGYETFENITAVEVHWLSGSVIVTSTMNASVFMEEDYTGDNTDYQLYYRVDGNKLIIQPCRSTSWLSLLWSGGLNLPAKSLRLSIPQSLQSLYIETVSADIDLYDASTKALTISTTSGQLSGTGFAAESLSFKSVSGNIDLSALQAQQLELETVSGRLKLGCENVPQLVGLESVSGDLILSLPKGAHCETQLDSVSGDVVTKNYSFGEKASCTINAHTVSGNVTLQNAQS